MLIYPDLDPEKKKYNSMEPILQKVNKCIALSNSDLRKSQDVLDKVVPDIIEEMKKIDVMFKAMYIKIFYGGGYYDGVKIQHPDEFDLDLVLCLPKFCKPSLEVSDIDGFVCAKLNNLTNFKKTQEYKDSYSKMDKLLSEDGYLLIDKVKSWFEGLINQAKNKLPYVFIIQKSGPAFTLKVDVEGMQISIDLVPSFQFESNNWPGYPFRRNPSNRIPTFLIVPKGPIGPKANDPFWRLSFQEQERELIIGKNRLKDTIRLLKLLKYRQCQDSIASYYIKTVVLWMTELIDDNFWHHNSLSYIFMMVFKYLIKLLEEEEIPYFWNENNNLLSSRKSITLQQWAFTMNYLIRDIEKSLNTPEQLDPEQLEELLFKIFGLAGSNNTSLESMDEKTSGYTCSIL